MNKTWSKQAYYRLCLLVWIGIIIEGGVCIEKEKSSEAMQGSLKLKFSGQVTMQGPNGLPIQLDAKEATSLKIVNNPDGTVTFDLDPSESDRCTPPGSSNAAGSRNTATLLGLSRQPSEQGNHSTMPLGPIAGKLNSKIPSNTSIDLRRRNSQGGNLVYEGNSGSGSGNFASDLADHVMDVAENILNKVTDAVTGTSALKKPLLDNDTASHYVELKTIQEIKSPEYPRIQKNFSPYTSPQGKIKLNRKKGESHSIEHLELDISEGERVERRPQRSGGWFRESLRNGCKVVVGGIILFLGKKVADGIEKYFTS